MRMGKTIALIAFAALLPLMAGCASSPTGIGAGASDEKAGFVVYFIDVGQADSSLIVCGEVAMLIDGGNAADSDLIYAFLKNHNISRLDCIVATHAHEDHVGGLAGALSYASAGSALCPVTADDSRWFESFTSCLTEQNTSITVPKPGDSFELGDANVEILAPVKRYDEPNDMSIVLKIVYGDTSFLFTGDAERSAEQDILDSGADISATVLHVGHHGSGNATTYPFLREVMPEYAVISCGAENSYGHPHDDLLSRLRDADATVYRTDTQGTIVCESDGKDVTFVTERGNDAPANRNGQTDERSDEQAEATSDGRPGEYIGNKKSFIFHVPSCANLPSDRNRVLFSSRNEALDAGFAPCGNCDP